MKGIESMWWIITQQYDWIKMLPYVAAFICLFDNIFMLFAVCYHDKN